MFEQNDIGNAKRFAERWRSEVAYCEEACSGDPQVSPWYVFSPEHGWWERIDESELLGHATAIAVEIRDEAELNNDEGLRRWAKTTGEVPRLKTMLTMARFCMTATCEELNLIQFNRVLKGAFSELDLAQFESYGWVPRKWVEEYKEWEKQSDESSRGIEESEFL